jgi:hypothetical protein
MNENHVIQYVKQVTKYLFSKYAILVVMFCSFGLASAQKSDGTGTVLSESNGESLRVNYVGYTTKDVKVSGNQLIIRIKEDTKSVDEVVIKNKQPFNQTNN